MSDGDNLHQGAEQGDLVVPSELRVGDRDLRYDLVVRPHLGDPIGKHIAAGTWNLSSAMMWLLSCIRAGDSVLDLGAHHGSFAIPAASLGARVTAVEGSTRNVAVLREASRCNELDLEIVHAVVAGRSEPVEFVDLGPYSTLATREIGSSTGYPAINLDARRVDDLLDGPFLWAKVDIEGVETAVIRGSPRIFRCLRGMVIESNGHMLHQHGSDPSRLVKAIEKIGMSVYEAYPGILRPLFRPTIQPETVIDYVAVRGEPVVPVGWTVSHARGQEELLRRLDLESRHHIEEHRAYARRTIANLGWRSRMGMRRAASTG